MKLIYILPTLNSGGAELRGIERINFLSTFPDIKIKLIVLSDKISLLESVDKRILVDVLHLKNAHVFSKKAFFSGWSNSVLLRKSIVDFNPDVIVDSLPISHHLARLAVLPLKNKIKVYQYHHATQFLENPIVKPSHKILHRMTKFLSKRVDYGHIFISEAVKEDISSHMEIKNGHVLYNAIPDLFDEVIHLKHEMNTTDFNIVIPGRLTPVKGHMEALRTIKDLVLKNSKIKIWILGDGSERKNIEIFIKENGLKNQIILKGELPHKNLLRYLYDSNIVLIPSLSEGLGNVAIESLMMGATVVSSDIGGLKEVINSSEIGYLYATKNPEELIHLLEDIYGNKRILSKEKIRASFLERFTLENHVNQFLKIISEN